MNAVVIGGSSGIGRAVCDALLKEGYSVTNASRTENNTAGVNNITLDVANRGDIERVLSSLAPIDVLVYSAGFSMAAPVEYVSADDYRYLFEVNFFGLVEAVQAFSKLMRDSGGGRVIAVSSMGGVLPIAFDAFYSSSKAAVDMFMRAASLELKPYNIHLTSVRPGATSTRFTFKRKVYDDGAVGVYGEKMNKAAVTLADAEQHGMSPEAVAGCIMSVIKSKNPPVAVSAGIVNKGIKLAWKLLPESAADFINKSFYMQ